ncbi:MAG: hypothetical protein ACO3FK_06030 [Vulcanococcus sp.]|jgi:hypothetical protein
MFIRSLHRTLTALVLLSAGSAMAGQSLWSLEKGVQSCIETSSAQTCRQAEAKVSSLKTNPAYTRSSHLCKEEISELEELIKLLPMRDAVPTEVMASVSDVQLACMPYGF